jgi:hypothetical protein
MTKETLLAAAAMGFFIVCPRVAAMLHIIAKHTNTPLYTVALIGTLFSVPLMLAIVWGFGRYGVAAAIGFCVFTDIVAALLLFDAGWKAPLETAVIALFVLIGVKIAPLVSRIVLQ